MYNYKNIFKIYLNLLDYLEEFNEDCKIALCTYNINDSLAEYGFNNNVVMGSSKNVRILRDLYLYELGQVSFYRDKLNEFVLDLVPKGDPTINHDQYIDNMVHALLNNDRHTLELLRIFLDKDGDEIYDVSPIITINDVDVPANIHKFVTPKNDENGNYYYDTIDYEKKINHHIEHIENMKDDFDDITAYFIIRLNMCKIHSFYDIKLIIEKNYNN